MKKFTLLSTIIILAGIMFSCKKYEDGPTISLRPRKERVANTWKVRQALRNNEDVTTQYDQYELYLSKGGDANLKISGKFFGVDVSTNTDGTWEFQNKDENIYLNFKDDTYDKTYNILKLKEDEMWLRESGGEDELHLIPR